MGEKDGLIGGLVGLRNITLRHYAALCSPPKHTQSGAE
jgi:hypothetical protein